VRHHRIIIAWLLPLFVSVFGWRSALLLVKDGVQGRPFLFSRSSGEVVELLVHNIFLLQLLSTVAKLRVTNYCFGLHDLNRQPIRYLTAMALLCNGTQIVMHVCARHDRTLPFTVGGRSSLCALSRFLIVCLATRTEIEIVADSSCKGARRRDLSLLLFWDSVL
jgi:hypothetical protein